MLKIKEYREVLGEDGKSIRRERIDLKELEKFGFTTENDEFLWCEPHEDICIDIRLKAVIVYGDCEEGNFSLDTLYDLIKADLVEKV